MKLILKNPKPRNPLVAAALRRKAGTHRVSSGGRRRRAESSLRRELDLLVKPSP